MSNLSNKDYQFTNDWFSGRVPIWEQYLSPFADRPNINLLEIGSWEGRSTCWLLKNILTHPTATITCIDTFDGSPEMKMSFDEGYIKSSEGRFDFNIAKTGSAQKVKKLVGPSQDLMRSLPLQSYDLIYVDGSHQASDVLADAILAWGLLKVGGLMIFDDYNFVFPGDPTRSTKIGIEAFLSAFSHKIVHQLVEFTVASKSQAQVFVEKISV